MERELTIKLPKLKFELSRGTIEVDGKRITFKGDFTEEDADRIVMSIEDNFWEYSVSMNTKKAADVKEMIAAEYSKISATLGRIIKNCDVQVAQGKVIIHVPERYSQYIGRLIGRGGANIKAIEQSLGIKISISQEKTPEEVALKNRLRDLMKNLINGGD